MFGRRHVFGNGSETIEEKALKRGGQKATARKGSRTTVEGQ